MRNPDYDRNLLPLRLKQLVVEMCRTDILEPANITDDEPIFGGSLGLDSFDAVELAIGVEEEFGVAICGRCMSHSAFASIASLADFIAAGTKVRRARRIRPAAARLRSRGLPLPVPAWAGRRTAAGP